MSLGLEFKVHDFFVRDQALKEAGPLRLDNNPDTTNLTAFADFSDVGRRLTRKIIFDGINCLASCHELLRSAIKVVECEVYQILLKNPSVPVNFHPMSFDPEQWRDIVKADLSKRFTKVDEPAWRVSIVEGDRKGQVYLTFHHAISDGLSAASAMNQLFEIWAELINNKTSELKSSFYDPYTIEKLYTSANLIEPSVKKDVLKKPSNYKPCYTDFVRLALDKSLTARIELFAKENREHFTVHSLLYAAFLKAVIKVKKPSFKNFSALNIVSFRKELHEENVMRPLFTWVICEVEDTSISFLELAKQIKHDLHERINKGEHKQNVRTAFERLLQNPTPEELIAEGKMSQNLINLSNIGKLNFSGKYGVLEMTTLDAAGGCTPYFDYSFQVNGVSMSLAVRTFQGCIRMVANFPRFLTDQQKEDDNVQVHRDILRIIKLTLDRNTPRFQSSKL